MKDFIYLSNTKLPIIKEGFKGNKYRNGKFWNAVARQQPRLKDMLGVEANPDLDSAIPTPSNHTDFASIPIHNCEAALNELPAHQDALIWLGHASFFIRLNGIGILTDPVYGNVALMRRQTPLPCSVATLVKHADIVVLSHGHRDHLDKPTLKKILQLKPEIQFLTPLKIGGVLNRLGIKNIQEAGWYQQFQLPNFSGLDIYHLPAQHWNKRGLFDFNNELWGSYMFTTEKYKLYFAGDTACGPHFEEIAELFPDIDTALMPIGAYKPQRVMKESHLSPIEAVEAFNVLGANNFVPMHYGTFNLSAEPAGEAAATCHNLYQDGTLKGQLQLLGIGEPMLL